MTKISMLHVRKAFLVLMGLAAIGVWSLPVHAEEDSTLTADSKKTDEKSAKGGEGGEGGAPKKGGNDDVSGGRFAGDPLYVHITPMVLPIISDQGAEQLVTVVIDVQVKDFDVADNMHTNMPRVRDALMRALYGGLGQGTLLRGGKLVDVNKIKAKATAALNDVMGGDGIQEVLIQGISQRML